MNLRRFAINNIWRNRGRYGSHLASAAFSVMIYFMYTSLAHHPYFQGGYRGAELAIEGIRAASAIIAIFTFLFLAYAGAAFTRSRMKEFGLLSLVGLTRGQLVRMILWENTVIALVALALGLGVGLVFLKLFFMIVSLLLRLPEPLPFYTGWSVWRQTVTVFGSFFAIVSLLSLRGVLKRNIVQLVKADRQPQTTPTFSRWRAALGVILVGGGYAWASMPIPNLIVVGIFPVTVMVSVGTYFVVREGSIALLHGLRRRERLYHRPGPFLTISRLIFKIQENYRVLSAVSIMVAVILTAVGTIFSFYVLVEADSRTTTPQAIQLAFAKVDEQRQAQAVAHVEAVLQKHGVTGLTPLQARLPKGNLVVGGGPKERIDTLYTGTELRSDFAVTVMPEALYRRLFRPQGQLLALADEQEGIHVHGFVHPDGFADESRVHRLRIGDEDLSLTVRDDRSGRLLNGQVTSSDVVVLHDDVFEQIVTTQPDAEYATVAVWTGPRWRAEGMREAVAELRAHYPADGPVELTATIEEYESLVSSFGLAMFIIVFVSLVFFAASCSLLYLRLFTEADEDRRYYTRLQQLGLSTGDVVRLARSQAMVVFFVPFVVGLVHSTFAMRALGTIIMRTVLHYGWTIAVAYLLLYGIYFAVTFTTYRRALRLADAVGSGGLQE